MMRRVMPLLCLLVAAGAFAQELSPQLKLVEAARSQVGITTSYSPAYEVLSFPNGDVPKNRGVCTDVVIRALRSALGMDLQKLVNEDMKAHFSLYPKNWGLSRTDRNIDHRRVPNLQAYFKRHEKVLQVSIEPSAFLPGDIVTSMLPGNLPHIMIVSDLKTTGGVPLVIHNIGRGAQEEDGLFRYPLTGHYRLELK